MSSYALQYWQPKWVKSNPHELTCLWTITAAKTVSPIFVGLPVLSTFDAISSQSTIDNYLGTVSEFTTAQFDATSMGNDTFGGLIAMQNQSAVVGTMVAECFSSTAGSTLVQRVVGQSTLADSTVETAVEQGAYGNIGFKINFGNTPDFDGLTSGIIKVTITYLSK